MFTCRKISVLVLCAPWVFAALPAAALTLKIDYSYDASQFFGNGNPQGAAAGVQAKTALEAAASFYSGILNDTLSSIQTPPPFHSSASSGTVNWQWSATFPNPSTGLSTSILNPTIPADQYIVYAGARSLPNPVLGEGAPGGYSYQKNPSGSFSPSEINQIDQIHAAFVDDVTKREEATGFATWGCSLAVDSDASANWQFDYLSPTAAGKNDFYSVVLHELTHGLGFGSISQWNSLLSGTTFTGSSAIGVYHQPVPLESVTDKSHWLNGLASRVFNGAANQETLMDPSLTTGSRKLLTRLDAAALVDLGWEIVLPTGIPGDFNHNGLVDAVDYTVWRDTLGRLGAGLAADASGNNIVDTADFNIWKTNFGQNVASGGGSGTTGSVPEPASIVSILVVAFLSLTCKSRSK